MKKILFAFTILLCCTGCETRKGSEAGSGLPQYTTLSSVDLYTGKGRSGDVLIPSVSRGSKKSDREKTLRGIMRSQGWVIISAFSTTDAYKQRSCAAYPDRPKAYKEGFIGKVDENGNFYD